MNLFTITRGQLHYVEVDYVKSPGGPEVLPRRAAKRGRGRIVTGRKLEQCGDWSSASARAAPTLEQCECWSSAAKMRWSSVNNYAQFLEHILMYIDNMRHIGV